MSAVPTIALAVAPPWAMRLISWRRRRLPVATSGAVGSNGGGSKEDRSDKGAVDVVAPRDPAREQIDRERHGEQDEREVEERGLLQLVLDVLDLDRDAGRERVAGEEERGPDGRG